MKSFEEITAVEFGQMMLIWESHNVNPLAMITLTKNYDDYLPAIAKYQPDAAEEATLIVSGSYPSKQAALSAIGQWWDNAITS